MRSVLLALLLTTISAQAAPAARADFFSPAPIAVPDDSVSGRAPALHADLLDYFTGSRSRMIQGATIAFGIGLVILMTSTRKR